MRGGRAETGASCDFVPLPENEIIERDCPEVVKTFPNESVDLVLTDPPYGISYKDHSGRTVAKRHRPYGSPYQLFGRLPGA
jgi:DNA modification methylase